MEIGLEAPLRAAVEFLEDRGLRYAIIGGVALSQWGVIRVTRDVVIKVLVPNTDYSAARIALHAAFPTSAHNQIPTNPLIVSVTIQDITVDFLLALPGYEELIIERAIRRDLNGWNA